MGARPISVRWLDTCKGDSMGFDVRSCLIGQETKYSTTLYMTNASTAFVVTPPLEGLGFLYSIWMSTPLQCGLVLMFLDISRAHPRERFLFMVIAGVGADSINAKVVASRLGKTVTVVIRHREVPTLCE